MDVINVATTLQELIESLTDFEAQDNLDQMENKAAGTVCSIMNAVLKLAADPRESRERRRNLHFLENSWKELKEADPEASWEKLLSYKPYVTGLFLPTRYSRCWERSSGRFIMDDTVKQALSMAKAVLGQYSSILGPDNAKPKAHGNYMIP